MEADDSGKEDNINLDLIVTKHQTIITLQMSLVLNFGAINLWDSLDLCEICAAIVKPPAKEENGGEEECHTCDGHLLKKEGENLEDLIKNPQEKKYLFAVFSAVPLALGEFTRRAMIILLLTT